MKAHTRRSETARALRTQARKHETAADTLASVAQGFEQRGYDAGVSAAMRACHAHRVWALIASARAHALRASVGDGQE